MSVRILHCADLHLDSPYESLPGEQARIMRAQQRKIVFDITSLAEKEAVDLVLLAGDLFDSGSCYAETKKTLIEALGRISARVFISPGNHDFFSPSSPYAAMAFPENVHVFRTGKIERVDIPELNCRVYGAGFTDPHMDPMLPAFRAEDDGAVNLMVIHGDLNGGEYNAVSAEDIASSGLDYLALGHVHSFSGILRSGGTHYAYPGCVCGRGFDETGEKGVILGDVSKENVSLTFAPLGGRQYSVVTIDMTGCTGDETEFVRSSIPDSVKDDVLKLVLTGEMSGHVDRASLADRAFYVTLDDRTHPMRDLWDGSDDDTLRGTFLRILRGRFDGGEEDAALAVRYGLAAMDGGEDFSL